MLTIQTSVLQVKETSAEALSSPQKINALCRDMAQMAQESFVVLTLDTKHKMIARHMVTLGLLDASLVHPREVFRRAIEDGASAIVIVHNHPSGDPKPSAEDLQTTKRLIDAGKIIDIHVLDHVIIGRPDFVSLRENGMISFN